MHKSARIEVEVIGPVHGLSCNRCVDAGFLDKGGDALDFCTCSLGQANRREWEASLAGVCCICGHAGAKEACLSCEARLSAEPELQGV